MREQRDQRIAGGEVDDDVAGSWVGQRWLRCANEVADGRAGQRLDRHLGGIDQRTEVGAADGVGQSLVVAGARDEQQPCGSGPPGE